MRVLDLMTIDVVTVRADDTLKEAARRMIRHRVSGLPVVDDHGKLVGIVTEGDFLAREMNRDHPEPPGLLSALFGAEEYHDEAVTVGEVMAKSVVTVSRDSSLSEAARMMAGHGVKRLPVVDGDGMLLGILSRADVVEAFTRPDELIEDEVREDVARRILFIEPDSITVDVKEGLVTLGGELASKTDARLLEELVRRLDGVVGVESRLTWKVDDTKISQD